MSATLFSETHSSNLKLFVQQPAIPQFRELLTQGVLGGAAALLIYAVIYSFFIDNYYKPLIVGALHEFLAIGALTGLAHGLVRWCYSRLVQDRLLRVGRFLTAVGVVAVGCAILEALYAPENKNHVDPWLLALWVGLQVISLSVMTGSKRRPWRALVYGVGRINTGQRLPGSAIGLLLRLVMLFASFEAIFLFVCVLQMNEELRDFVLWWLIVVDFVIGLVIALVNPRFWLTLSFALLINAPWLYRLMLYPNEPTLIKIITSGYLLLWSAFLLTRCRSLDPLFSSIRKELRYYYLVD
jgi:hypothetical protein